MTAYIRLEVRKMLRDHGFIVMSLTLPVVMYLLFSNLALGAQTAEAQAAAAAWSMVGMAAYGALGGAFSNGTGTSEDKALGWLAQLAVLPIPPWRVIAGKAATGAIIVVPSILLVLTAGGLVNGVPLTPFEWVAITLLLWVGTLPFSLFALGNAYLLSPQNSAAANLAGYLSLSILGGLWFPIEGFPDWLRAVSEWSPVAAYAKLPYAVLFGEAPSPQSLLTLLGWSAAFTLYAVYGFRRAGRTS
ncbi:ABC transporter permease [Herbidospora sp. RD11066]